MNFETALAYVKENHAALEQSGSNVLGVVHTPDDKEVKFYILELEYRPAEERIYSSRSTDGNGDMCGDYHCFLQGGDIPESYSIEGFYSGNTPSRLSNELDGLADKMSYNIYEANKASSGLMISYALNETFPDLPCPDDMENDYGQRKFKAAAIELINNLNADIKTSN